MAASSTKRTKKGASKAPSGVIDINLDDAEVRDTYDGDDPRPGFYTFELVAIAEHTSQAGNDGFRWTFVLRDDPLYDGWTRNVHSNLDPDSTKWKTEELLLALKGGKSVQGTKAAQVRLDVSDPKAVARFIKAAKLVRGRVQRRRDSEDDDPQFELGKIIALDEAKMAARKAAEAAIDDDDEDDEDGFEDADEFDDADEADDEDDADEDDDEDDEDSDEDDDEEDDDEDEDLDDDDDDDDEEEEEKPAPKKGAKKAAPKATSKPASKPAAKKAASKVTNIKAAKSAKAKRK